MSEDQACETPIIELLERVPEDARQMYEHGPTDHQNIPFGAHAKRAAAEIRSLQSNLHSAEEQLRDAKSKAVDFMLERDEALSRLDAVKGFLRGANGDDRVAGENIRRYFAGDHTEGRHEFSDLEAASVADVGAALEAEERDGEGREQKAPLRGRRPGAGCGKFW